MPWEYPFSRRSRSGSSIPTICAYSSTVRGSLILSLLISRKNLINSYPVKNSGNTGVENLLIFGPKNLPKLGKMFGKTINGFKKGMEDEEGSDDSEEKTEKQVSKKDEDEE